MNSEEEISETRSFVARNLGFRRHELGEAEFLVRELGGPVGVLAVDDDGYLDFGGRDKLDVDSAFAEAVEEARGHAGMGTHPNADHTELGDAGFGDQAGGLNVLYHRGQEFGGRPLPDDIRESRISFSSV